MFYILSILLIFPVTSQAEIKTYYEWANTGNDLYTGKCLELDNETNGKKYKTVVSKLKCKPEQTTFSFNKKQGRCVEVDLKTKGKNYFIPTNLDNCRTKNIIYKKKYIGSSYDCFMLDKETQGDDFFKRVDKKLCQGLPDESFYWKADSKLSGNCYIKLEDDNYKKIRQNNCKPEKTTFTFARSGPLKGYCYEQNEKDSSLYSVKTGIENCKNVKTIFVFLIPQNSQKGECYEIDENTRGDLYINTVKVLNCK